MKTGLEKGDRTTHELMLKCVIIITSVVPRQMPVQMAMAVNQALMSLTKNGIFCTEPYRVPFAGKVSRCLFDKTGTITTDALIPSGVINAAAATHLGKGSTVSLHGLKSDSVSHMNGMSAVIEEDLDPDTKRFTVRVAEDGDRVVAVKPDNLTLDTAVGPTSVPVTCAASEPMMVLSACHSLMWVEGSGLVGDPIELAGMRGAGWRYDAKTSCALPGQWEEAEKKIELMNSKAEKLAAGSAARAELGLEISTLNNSIDEAKVRAKQSDLRSIKILHRFHFSSALQRMSTVVDVTSKSGELQGLHCLVKGSPEAIDKLLADGAKPTWYDMTYRTLAESGFRVLALAFKPSPEMTAGVAPERVAVECNLRFAGFVAFECKIRTDSPLVITSLEQAALKTGMLTGDAPLTALHVAKNVGMCDKYRAALTLTVNEGTGKFGVFWAYAVGGSTDTEDFDPDTVEDLSTRYELLTTEAALEHAVELSGKDKSPVWDIVQHIKVFARMSPNGKARVIRAMQDRNGHHVLMCGDGGNDVGALKQADVGIALLGGFGNNMVGNETDEIVGSGAGEQLVGGAEDALNQQQLELQRKGVESAALRKKMMASLQ